MKALFWLIAASVPTEPIDVPPGELGRALETAAPGQELVLGPGRHVGSFVISKAVKLRGLPGAILEGPGKGMVLTLEAEGIEVVGLTIRGSGRDLGGDDAVVLVKETRRVTVRNCVVEARAFGIYIRGGAHNVIVDNVVRGDATLPEAQRGNGIHLWHTERNEVKGNEISSTRDGVYLSFAHDNEIFANHGTQLRYGIHYMYSERNHLRGNAFSDCVGGIALMFSKSNQIAENIALNNQRFGILCQMVEDSRFIGNRVEGNGRGLFLENTVDNVFRGNAVRHNGVGIFLTAGSERNTLAGNSFDSNVVQMYRSRASGNRWNDNGRGNYWSDYMGFDWDGDGIGEQPYRMETGASSLMANYPGARWLWRSPLLLLINWWEAQYEPPSSLDLDVYPAVAESVPE